MTLNRRDFVKTASGLYLSQRLSLTDRKPNVIIILADDLGYGDLGCYGGKIFTPNIDGLAETGVRFTNFHCTSPICSPSRASLLTGRYANRVGILTVIKPESDTGLLGEYSIADILRYYGYHTGLFGKWHLGHKYKEFLPTSHGFDKFHGIPYSNDMYPLPEIIDESIVGNFHDRMDQLTSSFTEYAINFIEESPQEKPYFLLLSLTAPHLPLEPSPEFRGKSGRGLYADTLLELDDAVGRVVKASQMRSDESTLIMFLSDNGALQDSKLSLEEQGSNGPFRGGKYGTYEGGIRVPFIASLPGVIPGDGECGELISIMDIKPTLGYLAGSDVWHLGDIDGVDIGKVLTGESDHVVRDVPLLHIKFDFLECASGEYFGDDGVSRIFKIRFSSNGAHELYDIGIDLGEQNNIAKYNSNVVTAMTRETKSVLATFASDTVRSYI